MATAIDPVGPRAAPIAADGYEKLLAVAGAILFACATIAILKGRADWAAVPRGVWLHLLTVLLATGLTPVMLLRRRGDAAHRLIGRVWVSAMLATAVITLFVRVVNPGRFSVIHVLSVWVLIQVPILWWTARTHRVARHRRSVRGMVTGALVIAGFFTFPFDRMLGHWLFG